MRRAAFDVKRFRAAARAALAAPPLLLIAVYRRLISPALPRRCRYEPTCSAYAEQAFRELGLIRGTIVAAWRLLRCNPFSRGGIDDLSDRTLFRDGAAGDHDHSHGAPA